MVSGHLCHMELPSFGILDLEWRAGVPRRVRFFSKAKEELTFFCPPVIRSFRLRTSKDQKGKRINVATPLAVEAETIYFLDRFEK
jgi:hypothetical protein